MEPMLTRDQLFGSMGHMRSVALFVETAKPDDTPLMTLKTLKPHHTTVFSLRDMFMKFAVDDPTEVTVALVVFGSVDFWNKLCEKTWMQPYLKEWRAEADQMRKSKAFELLWKEVEEEGRNSFQAAKYLIEEPWKAKKTSSRRVGRPNKDVEEVDPQAKEYSADIANLKDFIKK